MQCADIFGSHLTPYAIDLRVNETNKYYGHKDFAGTRVFFTNGEYDPWSASGFYYSNPGTDVETHYIKGNDILSP